MTVRLSLVFVSCIAVAGCNTRDVEITDPTEIENLARIPVPASARNIHCATDKDRGGPDYSAYGRFDIPKSDLPLVLAKMPADETLKTDEGNSNVMRYTMKQPWWQPKSLANRQMAQWSVPGFATSLLIGENGDKDTVTVYFFNFSL